MGRVRRSTLVLLAALAAAPAAYGADIPVTTAGDAAVPNADGVCSLREAVLASQQAVIAGCAAGTPGPDTILLGPGAFALSLPGVDDLNATGDIDIPGQSLRIVGRGPAVTAIQVSSGDRAFHVFSSATVALEDLAIRGGVAALNNVDTFPGGHGGAIRNNGALTVARVAFEGNAAGRGGNGNMGSNGFEGGNGGAIWSGGAISPSVTVVDSSFTGNHAGDGGTASSFMGAGNGGPGGAGGAISIDAGALTVSGSTFAGNRAGDGGDGGSEPPAAGTGGAGGAGGAIAAAAGTTVGITTSTFAGNRAGTGGLVGGSATLRSASGDAGALHAAGATANVEYATFAGNVAGAGASGPNGILGARVAASILADPAPACNSVTASLLRNVALAGDPSCPGPRLDGDPRLGPLAANGGPTATMLPGAGSAAIDALAGAPCPAADQRGLPRPRLGGCDAGAVEVQAGAAAPPAPRRTTGLAARRVSSLVLSPATFRAARSGGSVGALTKALQQRAPIGTTVRYRLDGAARVTFTVTKAVPGRRKGKRCVKPGAAKAGAKRCSRTQKLKGSFAHAGVAGRDSFRFTGRLRGKALPPGRYTLVARLPRPATGAAALARKAFRIVR